ncbi:tail completion protein gp17 [Pseudomonas sp.]|uniref:tail completion protein gp17 n=1 Tax=Pseudomonas sp. TaxID=306 RepID=UPI003FD6F9BF
MFAPIFAVCAADAGVTALLGTSPTRLYPFGEAPQDTVNPYAVWQMITGSPENYLAGRPDVDDFTLQVDAYAPTGSQVRAIAAAIRDAIELQAYIIRWGGESRDPQTKTYRYSFDVDWLVPR